MVTKQKLLNRREILQEINKTRGEPLHALRINPTPSLGSAYGLANLLRLGLHRHPQPLSCFNQHHKRYTYLN